MFEELDSRSKTNFDEMQVRRRENEMGMARELGDSPREEGPRRLRGTRFEVLELFLRGVRVVIHKLVAATREQLGAGKWNCAKLPTPKGLRGSRTVQSGGECMGKVRRGAGVRGSERAFEAGPLISRATCGKGWVAGPRPLLVYLLRVCTLVPRGPCVRSRVWRASGVR